MSLEYIIKRLLLALLTLLIILFASYMLLRLAPGDPTKSNMLNSGDAGSAVSAEKGGLRSNNALREKLHLDRPAVVGFYYWLRNVLKGDLGESATVDPGRRVLDLIAEHLPVTMMTFPANNTHLLIIPWVQQKADVLAYQKILQLCPRLTDSSVDLHPLFCHHIKVIYEGLT